MRHLVCLSVVLLTGCSTAQLSDGQTQRSSASSVTSSFSSHIAGAEQRGPSITLSWVEKKLPPIIAGKPRRKLSLQLTGAQRELVYIGTFNGETFDLTGTFVQAPNAIVKASIGWNGAGDEIWIERRDAKTLIARHRDINEDRPYLTVDKTLVTIPIVEGALVKAK